MQSKIPARLRRCAELVPRCKCFADIGTDHAYLAIYLLKSGICERAVCSDINRGPLMRARANVSAAELDGRVDFYLLDGADFPDKVAPDVYAVCGMGGELIADIISRAPRMHCAGVQLVLQPMSRPEALREYLASSGFEIFDERYVKDSGKYYVCIAAEYSGRIYTPTPEWLVCGDLSRVDISCEAVRGYFSDRAVALTTAMTGKTRGMESTEYEEKILQYIEDKIFPVRRPL